jgi:hypothetical protein
MYKDKDYMLRAYMLLLVAAAEPRYAKGIQVNPLNLSNYINFLYFILLNPLKHMA